MSCVGAFQDFHAFFLSSIKPLKAGLLCVGPNPIFLCVVVRQCNSPLQLPNRKPSSPLLLF